MRLAEYRKAVAVFLTALATLAVDYGLDVPPWLDQAIDPAAFALACLLVWAVPNAAGAAR